MAEIRHATPADVDAIVAMGRAMHAESPRYQGMQFDEAKVRALAGHVTAAPGAETAVVLLATQDGVPVGMFAGLIALRWFGPDPYATDLVVYVSPEHRGSTAFVRLVRAAERWAAERGVEDFAIGVTTGVHTERTVHAYQQLGFTLAGHILTKTLHVHRNGNRCAG